MEGQLHWDGVVLPIPEVTWGNVLATAKALQGLNVDDDFYLTYKDEEGDVINVKNEVDLDEAIRWAKEQGVPNLCLEVPFSSAEESDSDDSWMEVDDGSPKVPRHVTPQVPSTLDLTRKDSVSVEDDHSPQDEANQAADVAKTKVESSDATEDHTEVEPESETPSHETEAEILKPQVVEVTPIVNLFAEAVAFQAVEITPIVSVVAETGPSEVVEVAPIATFLHQQRPQSPVVVTPMPFMFEERAPAPVSAISLGNIEKILELLYTESVAPGTEETDDMQLFLKFLSDRESVRELVAFLAHDEVQRYVVAVADAEKAQPGTAWKTASTQLIKLMYQSPAVSKQLFRIPNLKTLLPRILRMLKTVSVKEEPAASKPSQVHENVTCDGCESSQEQKDLAAQGGYRNGQGDIVGVRYKSAVLPNYDLCACCEASGLFQNHGGPFLKIIDPATAPEVILCALPGASAGMMSQVDSLDWRNPLARQFLDFVESRRQRAFPQQRTAEPTPAPTPAPACAPAETLAVSAGITLRCKHALKMFETPHGSFTCDVCMKKQPSSTVMHGCRACNFDVCNECNIQYRIAPTPGPSGTVVPAPAVVALARASAPPQVAVSAVESAPPQAKFISDVTLADGCVVRPGEQLTKTWRVRNSGAEPWPAGTRIGHVGGDAFGGPLAGVEVPLAAPGQAVNVSVPLVMPTQPGRYTSYWRMMTPHPQSSKFGHRFWVTVNVVAQVTPPSVPVPQGQPRAFPGQIIRAPPPPPTVQGLRGIFPAPPSASAPPGFLTGSPFVARPSAARPAPPSPVAPMPAAEEPVVLPELELAVAQITEFGFADIDKIVKILKEVNGDAGAAIDKLLEEA
jgi:hypothetical protein